MPTFLINKKLIIVILVGLVLIAGSYVTFNIISNKEPEITLVTTRTPRPSRTPLSSGDLSSIFTGISKIDYEINEKSTVQNFYEIINKEILAEKSFRLINFTKASQPSAKLEFKDILGVFKVGYNDRFIKSIGSDFKFLVYGQKEIFSQIESSPEAGIAKGKRIVIVVETVSLSETNQALTDWEKTIIGNLREFLDIKSPDGATFSDNIYKGIKVRFNNFSMPDKSLDYSIVPASNGKNYIVITNSRESMYSTLDMLRGN